MRYNDAVSTVRIILADDHAVVRAGIANALRELPEIEIVGEVGDGDALFATLAMARADMLLTDVTMPHFEPIGTIRQIRALSRPEHSGRQRLRLPVLWMLLLAALVSLLLHRTVLGRYIYAVGSDEWASRG